MLFISISLISILLFKEYRFFKKQTEQLIDLQEDYKNYISALRRVFESQKADNQEVESILEEKKKPFVVINREKDYLRKSLLDYLKKNKLDVKLRSLKNYYSDNKIDANKNLKIKTKNNLAKANPRKRKKVNRIYNSFANEDLKKEANFIWPIKHNEFWLSSFFGLRKVKKGYSFHYGLDLAAMKGTLVKAASSGVVVESAYSSGYGNTVVISHDKKFKTRYAHLNSISVRKGAHVIKGQKIGTVGDTGSVRSKGKDASHLHFEVYVYGKQVNPLYVLQ